MVFEYASIYILPHNSQADRQWQKTNFLCFYALLFACPFSAYEPLPGSGSLLSLCLFNRCPALSFGGSALGCRLPSSFFGSCLALGRV